MSSDNTISLFQGRTAVNEDDFATQEYTELGRRIREQNGPIPGDMEDIFNLIKTKPRELRLNTKMLEVSVVLENSILGNLIDFSSERARFAIIFYKLWERKLGLPRLTQEEVNKILSFGSFLDEEISKMLLHSIVFSEIVFALDKDLSIFCPIRIPVNDGEIRIETINQLEFAFHQAILSCKDDDAGPEKFLVEQLLDRNIKRRIVQGLEHGNSPYIDKEEYQKVRSLLIAGKDVKIALRTNGFVVTKKQI